jgi:hypothetical protein
LKTPWHLWIIGVLSLLWNAAGAFDFTMTQMRTPAYMSSFTPDQLNYFYGFPSWVVLSWGLGVWAALLGSVLLLARSGHAVLVFALSFLGMVATSSYSYLLSGVDVGALIGPIATWFSLLVMVVGLGLIVYARAMRRRGVLR